jgi:alpha-beta hydrolase superfamily lysophospholipase
MIRIVFILLCMVSISVCSQRNTASPVASRAHTTQQIQDVRQWVCQPDERAVTIIIHGLNLKPAKMDRLAAFFAVNKITTLRVSLAGHRGSLEEFKHVTREVWYREVATSFAMAHEYAEKKSCPYFYRLVAGRTGRM